MADNKRQPKTSDAFTGIVLIFIGLLMIWIFYFVFKATDNAFVKFETILFLFGLGGAAIALGVVRILKLRNAGQEEKASDQGMPDVWD